MLGDAHDLEGMGDDADGHHLLAVVAAVHHEGVGETLNDGAVGLAETLGGIATGRVREVDGSPDLDVVAEAHKVPLASNSPARESKSHHVKPAFRISNIFRWFDRRA